MIPFDAAPIKTTWSFALDVVASFIRFASSQVTPSKICDCGPADILSARRLSLIYRMTTKVQNEKTHTHKCNVVIINDRQTHDGVSHFALLRHPLSFVISFHSSLTNCCNFLNSFGFVPGGTNCNGFSMRTAVECVGEPSATHCAHVIGDDYKRWNNHKNVCIRINCICISRYTLNARFCQFFVFHFVFQVKVNWSEGMQFPKLHENWNPSIKTQIETKQI